MAVYRGPGDRFETLIPVACDNNSGANGRTSSLHFYAVAGTTYYIVVDGVAGATGTAYLNYSLVQPGRLSALGRTVGGANRIRISGHAQMRFTIQYTSDLRHWTSLVTIRSSTSVYDYTDNSSVGAPRRIYRALMLP